MAYVLRLEDLAREADTYALANSLALALGKEAPTEGWDAIRARFDAALREPLDGPGRRDDSPRGIKLRALGVPG